MLSCADPGNARASDMGNRGFEGGPGLTSRDAGEASLPFPDRLKLVGDGQQTVEELAVRVVEESAAAAEATAAAAVALESSAVQAERRPTCQPRGGAG